MESSHTTLSREKRNRYNIGMNDLVPYAFPDALGTKNVLVVPIVWADQKENANNETLAPYRKSLGRVMDERGAATDYSDVTDQEFSLSEYFDISSYGKLTLNSFMTDWYYAKENFAEVEPDSPSREFADGILDWVKTGIRIWIGRNMIRMQTDMWTHWYCLIRVLLQTAGLPLFPTAEQSIIAKAIMETMRAHRKIRR